MIALAGLMASTSHRSAVAIERAAWRSNRVLFIYGIDDARALQYLFDRNNHRLQTEATRALELERNRRNPFVVLMLLEVIRTLPPASVQFPGDTVIKIFQIACKPLW